MTSDTLTKCNKLVDDGVWLYKFNEKYLLTSEIDNLEHVVTDDVIEMIKSNISFNTLNAIQDLVLSENPSLEKKIYYINGHIDKCGEFKRCSIHINLVNSMNISKYDGLYQIGSTSYYIFRPAIYDDLSNLD